MMLQELSKYYKLHERLEKHPYLAQIFYIFKHLGLVRRDPRSHFERIKACQTPMRLSCGRRKPG